MESLAHEIASCSVLPENHDDQLQLGFRMIQNAYNNKMSSLEQEVRGLRLTCEEQKNQVAGLQRKNSALEVELVEGHQRARQLADENKELFKTVQQLRKQLGRLEGLKKSVLDSIASHQQAECEQDDNKLYMQNDYLKGAAPITLAAVQSEQQAGLHNALPGYSRPASPPRTGHGEQPAAPYMSPGPPAYAHAAHHGHLHAAGPPVAAAAPPPAAVAPSVEPSPAVDGKQFFRKARSSLSYEAFNEFLAHIKRLNNQQQTREETLDQARRIFGPQQQHLYTEFEHLLNRHAGPGSMGP